MTAEIEQEQEPKPKLSDPSAVAVGAAMSIVVIIKDQQKRIEHAENRVAALRAELAAIKKSAPYGEWCRDPAACLGKGYCPKNPTCGD